MSAWWLAAGVLVGVVSLIALVRVVIALVRLHRGSVLLTVPLASERVVHFDEAGAMLLNVEGPALSRRFGGLGYALADATTGVPVRTDAVLMPTKVAGLTRVRLSVRTLVLPRAGDYRLSVSNLDPQAGHAGHDIVFSRDIRRSLVVKILQIVLVAFVATGSIALTIVALLVEA